MKKAGLLIAAVILMASCSKDDTDPKAGFDSQLKFQGIQFYYNILIADSVKGYADFQFLVTDSTMQQDTVSFSYSFRVNDPISDHTVYFNTPANTSKANFKVKFVVYDGSIDSVHIDHCSYIKNNTALWSAPVYFNDTLPEGTYITPTISYSF